MGTPAPRLVLFFCMDRGLTPTANTNVAAARLLKVIADKKNGVQTDAV